MIIKIQYCDPKNSYKVKSIESKYKVAWLIEPRHYRADIYKKAEKLIKNSGRLLIRKSGTEPKIRVMGESDNRLLLLKCIRIIKQSIK